MSSYSKFFFISNVLFSFFCIGTVEAVPNITWEIKEGSSNLSFFHKHEDLKILAPKTAGKNVESAFDQYKRIFSDAYERKAYMDRLEKIVKDSSVTDWNEGDYKYRSNYTTACDNNRPAAFCQDITLRVSNLPFKSRECLWHIGDQESVKGSCIAYSTSIPIDKDISVKVEPLNGSNKKSKTSVPIQGNVRVEGKVILALGDSFASGEGNPDRPAKHDNEIPKAGSGYSFFLSRGENWEKSKENGPLWSNRACHRSLLSYQFKVALQYAAENPKQRVVFASFSCTGAKITEGLLQPQKQKKLPYSANDNLKLSQLDSAMDFLCSDTEEGIITVKGIKKTIINCRDFSESKFRKPDLILLSVGGNDVGFAGLILNTFSPTFQIHPNFTIPLPDPLKTVMRFIGEYKAPEQVKTIIETNLRDLYDELDHEFKVRNLTKHASNVIQTNYPNLVENCDQDWNENSNYKLTMTKPEFNSLGSHGGKFLVDLELSIPYYKQYFDDRIDMSISKEESENISKQVINKLQEEIAKNKKYEWTIVQLKKDEIYKHGICALDEGKSAPKTFEFPYREENEGHRPKWKDNVKPSDWLAYSSERKRWFNTIDDSIMKLATRECPESWQSSFGACAEMLMGAIHPNLAYHARIADEVYKEAKKNIVYTQKIDR